MLTSDKIVRQAQCHQCVHLQGDLEQARQANESLQQQVTELQSRVTVLQGTYLTIKAASSIYDLSRDIISAAISDGEIPAADVSKPGSQRPQWRILRSDIQGWIDKRTKAKKSTMFMRFDEKTGQSYIEVVDA